MVLYAMSADYYRGAAESVVYKLANNYRNIERHARVNMVKLAVDNIERQKAVLKEISKLKYSPINSQMYTNIAYMLTGLEAYLLKQRYGDNRPNAEKRVIEDLVYVDVTLSGFREDLARIMRGKSLPLWYANITSDKLKERERAVAKKYYSMYKEPLSVYVYLI